MNKIVKRNEEKSFLYKESIKNLLLSWGIVFVILFCTSQGLPHILNDSKNATINDLAIKFINGLLVIVLAIIPPLSMLNTIILVKDNGKQRNKDKMLWYYILIVFILFFVSVFLIVKVYVSDMILLIIVSLCIWLICIVLKKLFGKVLWENTGLTAFVVMLLLNIFVLCSVLFFSNNPFKSILANLLTLLLINIYWFSLDIIKNVCVKSKNEFINTKVYKGIDYLRQKPDLVGLMICLYLVGILMFIVCYMVNIIDDKVFLVLYNKINEYAGIIKVERLVIINLVVNYFTFTYLMIFSFSKIIVDDDIKIYWKKKMNYVWNLFCMVIAMILLIVLKFDIVNILDFSKDEVELMASHRSEIHILKNYLIETIGIVGLFVTYLSARNDNIGCNDNKQSEDTILKNNK